MPNWKVLSRDLPPGTIIQNPHHPWEKEYISINPRITLRDVRILDQLLSKDTQWNWHGLSLHIPIHEILANPHEPWDIHTLLRRPDFTRRDHAELVVATGTTNYIELNPASIATLPIDEARRLQPEVQRRNPSGFPSIVNNPGITLEDRQYLHLPSSDILTTLGKIMPMNYIRSHSNEQWSRYHLSQNPYITLEDVETLELPRAIGEWEPRYLAENLPIEDIQRDRRRIYDRKYISSNPHLRISHIDTLTDPHITGRWNWNALSETLPMDDIRANPHRPWNRTSMRANKEYTVIDGNIDLEKELSIS